SGLSDTYVRTYGWEESLLSPRRLDIVDQGTRSDLTSTNRSLIQQSGPSRNDDGAVAEWLRGLGLAVGRAVGAVRLAGARPRQDGGFVTLVLERGGVQIDVVLRKNGSGSPAFTRTPSFELSYSVAEDRRSTFERVAPLAVEAIRDHLL